MRDRMDSPPTQARGRSKGLLVAATIFGLLYLIFIVVSFIPAPGGSPVSTSVPFDPFDLEQIFVKSLFLLFLAGYLAVWKHEGIGGAVFILWHVGMLGVEFLVVRPVKPADWGGGIAMGLPLFVLGVLFVRRRRRAPGHAPSPDPRRCLMSRKHPLHPGGRPFIGILASVLLGSGCAREAEFATTPEENKEIVRRVMAEGVNRGDLEVFREMLAPGYVRHSQATTEMPEIHGVEEMLAFLRWNFTAFPDWHEEIDLMIAEGDKVAYITTGTGTHTGPMGDIPPTEKKVEVVNFIVQRIEGGKIAESWVGWDNLAVLMQLGLLTDPEATGS